jgi:hypothetical protein
MKVDRKRAAQQRRIAAALADVGFALPGSLTVRAYRCGKTNCRCRGEPPQLHGPYAFWTRKVNGKTVTRTLSDEELAEYQPFFDNARKLRALVNELQELTLQLVEADHGNARPAPGKSPEPTKPRRSKATKAATQ